MISNPTQTIRHALGIRGKTICFSTKFTPALAKKALSFHDDKINRRHYDSLSDRYAAAMKRGEWQANGETIKFSTQGKLIDGQHRLKAIIKSEQTIPLMVVLDLAPSAFKTIDTGRVRSAADVLAIHGEKSCVILAAALRLLGCYRYSSLDKETNYRIDNSAMLALLDAEPAIRNSIQPVHNGAYMYVQKLMRPRIGVFCHYIFSGIDADITEYFFIKLADGLKLKRNEPVTTLRAKLLDNLSLPQERRATPVTQLAYVFIAFKSTRDKQALPKLEYQPFGKNPDAFPTL